MLPAYSHPPLTVEASRRRLQHHSRAKLRSSSKPLLEDKQPSLVTAVRSRRRKKAGGDRLESEGTGRGRQSRRIRG
jgi:hypothetical protein